ncbi:MAG TPA: PKD domain-containing protein [Clostridiales bacterium]|nr:PKD domain-containing protein [Clostridiales bacterium]
MKKLVLLFAAFMLFSVIFISCSDDDKVAQVKPEDYKVEVSSVDSIQSIITPFVFNAVVIDDNDNPSKQTFAWDFNSDGTWDTEWKEDKQISWKFPSVGVHKVTLGFALGGAYINSYSTQVIVEPITASVTTPTSQGSLLDKFSAVAVVDEVLDSTTQLEFRLCSNTAEATPVWTEWITQAAIPADSVFNNKIYSKPFIWTYKTEGDYVAKFEIREVRESGKVNLTSVTQNYKVIPLSGTTINVTSTQARVIDTFTFVATIQRETEGQSPVFQWDYDGDGIYDSDWIDEQTKFKTKAYSISNPSTYKFSSDGTFTSKVKVAVKGATSVVLGEFTKSVTVKKVTAASITFTPATGGTVIDQFSFTAGISQSEASLKLEYRWDFNGNGTYDTEWSATQPSKYKYTAAGSYLPKVQIREVRTNEEIELGEFSSSVTVNQIANNIVTFYIIPETNARFIDKIQFNASFVSPDDGDKNEYRWDFDNDGKYDTDWLGEQDSPYDKFVSYSQDAFWKYPQAGQYTAKVQIKEVRSDSEAIIGVFQKVVTVTGATCTLNLISTQTNITNTFLFEVSTPNLSTDTVLEYRFDFDNNGTFDTAWSTSKQGSTKYSSLGNKVAVVQVRENRSGTYINVGSFEKQVSVTGLTATIAVTSANSSFLNPRNFTATVPNVEEGSVLEYRWDFDTNGTIDTDWLSVNTASWKYSKQGNYTATLEVREKRTSENVVIGGGTKTVTVGSVTGVNVICEPDSALILEQFTFNVDNVHKASDILEYQWDFESDGVWDTDWIAENTVAYKYSKLGKFRAKVVIRENRNGEYVSVGTFSAQNIATVLPVVPIITYATPMSNSIINTFNFTAEIKSHEDLILEFQWNFDGGEADTDWLSKEVFYDEWGNELDTTFISKSSFKFSSTGTFIPEVKVREKRPSGDPVYVGVGKFTTGLTVGPISPNPVLLNTTANRTLKDTFQFRTLINNVESDVVLQYRWDFNADGVFDTDWFNETLKYDEVGNIIENYTSESNSSYRYLIAGSYRPIIAIREKRGNLSVDLGSNFATTSFTVSEVPSANVIITVAPSSDNYLKTFTFSAAVSGEKTPVKAKNTYEYRWDFNGDGSYEVDWTAANTQSWKFSKNDIGTNKTIKVLVRDVSTDVPVLLKTTPFISNTFTITDPSIGTNFTVTPSDNQKTIIETFDFTATVGNTNSDTFLEFMWDFDNNSIWDTDWIRKSADGSSSISDSETWKYSATGNKTAKVKVREVRGNTYIDLGEKTTAVIVDPIAPTLSATGTTVNDTFQFSSLISNVESDVVLEYRWDFDGDNIYDTEWFKETPQYDNVGNLIENFTSISNNSYKYVKASNYNSALLVREKRNAESIDLGKHLKSVTVSNVPVANVIFTVEPTSANYLEPFTFKAVVSNKKSPVKQKNTYEYSWDLNNDGTFEIDWSSSDTQLYKFSKTDIGANKVAKVMIRETSTGTPIPLSTAPFQSTAFSVTNAFNNITVTPAAATVTKTVIETFGFGASVTHTADDTVLEFMWDFNNDTVWDTGWIRKSSAGGTIITDSETWKYEAINNTQVAKVKIREVRGTNYIDIGETTTSVVVNKISPAISLLNSSMTLKDTFQFRSLINNVESGVELEYSWDFNTDGISDTDWFKETTQYDNVGNVIENFTSISNAEYKYSVLKNYTATLHIREKRQSKTIDLSSFPFSVNMQVIDPALVNFSVTPATGGTIVDYFTFSVNMPSKMTKAVYEYKWDFDNNGTYETDWTTANVQKYKFSAAGTGLTAKVDVRENRSGSYVLLGSFTSDNTFSVNAITSPVMTPTSGVLTKRLIDTFDFKAVFNNIDPSLVYDFMWDFDSDGVWDTNWTRKNAVGTPSCVNCDDPVMIAPYSISDAKSWKYSTTGLKTVTVKVCEVRDGTVAYLGQYTTTVNVINPTAVISPVTNTYTDLYTNTFGFGVRIDDVEPNLALKFIWDYDSNGIWDTEWINETPYGTPCPECDDPIVAPYSIIHSADIPNPIVWKYSSPGTYTAAVKVCEVRPNADPVYLFTLYTTVNATDVNATINLLNTNTTVVETFEFEAVINGIEPAADIEYQWDFNGDGKIDTEWLEDTPWYDASGNQIVTYASRNVSKFKFDSDGTYTTRVYIREVRSDKNIYLGSWSRQTVVGQLVGVNILVNSSNSRLIDTFTFNAGVTNVDDGDVLKYRWDFDNNGSWDTDWLDEKPLTKSKYASLSEDTSWKYKTSGVYTAVVQVKEVRTDGYEEIIVDSYSQAVTVNPVTPAITYIPAAGGTMLDTYVLTATVSDIEKGTNLEYRWDFNGDTTWDKDWSSDISGSYKYPANAVYNAIVEIREKRGTDDIITVGTYNQTVNVGVTPPPVTITVSPVTARFIDTFKFNASMENVADGDSLYYKWDYENDGTYDTGWLPEKSTALKYTSSSTDAIWKYDTTGNYNVRLAVKEKRTDGTEVMVVIDNTTNVTVTGVTATVNVTPTTGSLLETYSFSADIASLEKDIKLEYRWDFDNNGSWDAGWDSLNTAQYKYKVNGVYDPTVEIRESRTDGFISVGTYSYAGLSVGVLPAITINVNPLNARFIDTYNFTAGMTNVDDGDSLLYRWDFENDGVYDTGWIKEQIMKNSKYASLSENVIWKYNAAGTYTVKVEAKETRSDGTSVIIGTQTQNLVVGVVAASISISVSPNPTINNTFIFTGTVTPAAGSDTKLQYRWDFEGDSVYDTNWSDLNISEWQYKTANTYHPVLEIQEVRNSGNVFVGTYTYDPAGLIVNVVSNVTVTAAPVNGLIIDTYSFNASVLDKKGATKDVYEYRWNFDGIGAPETDWVTQSAQTWKFSATALNLTATVEIRENRTGVLVPLGTFTSNAFNVNPIAPVISPVTGTVTKKIIDTFDFSIVLNNVNPDLVLDFMWDFDSDGVWDTDWTRKTAEGTPSCIDCDDPVYTAPYSVSDSKSWKYRSIGTKTAKVKICEVRTTGQVYLGEFSTNVDVIDLSSAVAVSLLNPTASTILDTFNFKTLVTGVESDVVLEYMWDYDYDTVSHVWDTNWTAETPQFDEVGNLIEDFTSISLENHQYTNSGTFLPTVTIREKRNGYNLGLGEFSLPASINVTGYMEVVAPADNTTYNVGEAITFQVNVIGDINIFKTLKATLSNSTTPFYTTNIAEVTKSFSLNTAGFSAGDYKVTIEVETTNGLKQNKIINFTLVEHIPVWEAKDEVTPGVGSGYVLKSTIITSDLGYLTVSSEPTIGTRVIKYDTEGNLLWSQNIPLTTGIAESVIEDISSDGGFVLAGWVQNGIQKDTWVRKISGVDGSLIWNKNYGYTSVDPDFDTDMDGNEPIDDGATIIRRTIDGGYIVGGYTYNFYGDDTFMLSGLPYTWNTGYDVRLLKLYSNGNEVWGYNTNYVSHKMWHDISLHKKDPDLWSRTMGDQMITDIVAKEDGNYLITGWNNYGLYFNDGTSKTDMFYAECDMFGGFVSTTTWSRMGAYDAENMASDTDPYSSILNISTIQSNALGDYTEDEKGYGIAIPQDGGFGGQVVMVGETHQSDSKARLDDAWVLELGANFDEDGALWESTFGQIEKNEKVYSVDRTKDGGYIVAGYRTEADQDLWLIKLDSKLKMLWSKNLGVPGNDSGVKVLQTNDGGYIIGANDFSTATPRLIKVNKTGDVAKSKVTTSEK